MVNLTTNLDDPQAVPYFLWDEPMTVSELRHRLAHASEAERFRLLGKVLREARDSDAWHFTTPQEVQREWRHVERHLGRRKPFWVFLLSIWRELGLLTPQRVVDKPLHGMVRIDPPEEILANKLCTLLSRAEIRDLVDVMALDRAGFRIEDAIPFAQAKDAGLTPAQLAWVLSSVEIGEDSPLPGGISAVELRSFQHELCTRLGRLAWP
ncbi:MAG: nucleotidyl transferase AbiEii/AbiGii toxin family protein [Planctomycetota bacterium]